MTKSTAVSTPLQVFKRILGDYNTTFSFVKSDEFKWSFSDKTISYDANHDINLRSINSLLHELSHGILGHSSFTYDIELLGMEAAAWSHAEKLANDYKVSFDSEYSQQCLESYRSWLHERAECPTCTQICLEEKPQQFHCFNCSARWKVSKDQLCKIQRRRLHTQASSE